MTHDPFELVDERMLPDFSGDGMLIRHRKTGAEVLAVQNDDPEMVFGVLLETLPSRSDGVAHLLEHLVFRGSKRYPHTHLYAGLIQGTLLTGLNATTRADSTLFHVSSSHPNDFSNLIDVVMDAVFHPLLREADFFEERDVVMNEMIGHQAVPLNRMSQRLRQELLPGSVYSLDAGGNPACTAALSSGGLRAFHAANYHPGRTRLFLWGNIDLKARLDQLDQLLSGQGTVAVSSPTVFERFDSPRRLKETVPSPDNGLSMTGVGWVFDTQDSDLLHAVILGLMGGTNPILRRALADVGGRVLGCGFSTDTPFGSLEIILAGHGNVEQASIISTIENTLEEALKSSTDGAFVRDAMAQFEYQLLTLMPLHPGPTGLHALNMILGNWRHGSDPLALLDIGKRLTILRAKVADQPDAVAQCITENLLENPHQLVLTMIPETRVSLTGPVRPAIKAEPDPLALSVVSNLPSINLSDAEMAVSRMGVESDGAVLDVHVPGPSLARAEMAIALSSFDAGELDLVSIMLLLLKSQPASVGMEVSARLWAGLNRAGTHGVWLSFLGRSLQSFKEDLLDHLNAFLRQPFPTADILQSQINAELAASRSQVAAFGYLQCETRLRALGGVKGVVNERLYGMSHIQTLGWASQQNPDDLMARLEKMRTRILSVSERTLATSGIPLASSQRIMAEQTQAAQTVAECAVQDFAPHEAISTGAANFSVGQSLRIDDVGAAHVAAHMLETGWLWDSVRVAGGAYSVRCRYDKDDGLLSMLSIRDPSALNALSQFHKAPIWLSKNGQGALLERCVAAKTGHLARPVRPDECLSVALRRYLCGETDAMRQVEMDHVRSVDAKAMREVAETIQVEISNARTVVLGPREGLNAVAAERPGIVIQDG